MCNPVTALTIMSNLLQGQFFLFGLSGMTISRQKPVKSAGSLARNYWLISLFIAIFA